jgi:hypothetical protein
VVRASAHSADLLVDMTDRCMLKGLDRLLKICQQCTSDLLNTIRHGIGGRQIG